MNYGKKDKTVEPEPTAIEVRADALRKIIDSLEDVKLDVEKKCILVSASRFYGIYLDS